MTNEIEEQVTAAAAAIVSAFGSHNTAAYFDGFASDASFVFYTSPERLDSRAAYERLWAEWESEAGFKVHGCVSRNGRVQLHAGVGIFVHDVETDVELDAVRTTVFERETIVFESRDGQWLAVHEHLSPQP